MPKKSSIRKSAAIGLAFLGLAGVTVASAATLDLSGGGDHDLVQSGVIATTVGLCQTTTINVSVALANGAQPGTLQAGSPFGYVGGPDVLLLDEIDAACAGHNVKVALGNPTDQLLAEYSSSNAVPGNLEIGFADLTVQPGADLATVSQVAVTIYE